MRKPIVGPLLILLVGALLEAVASLLGGSAANQLPSGVQAHSLLLYVIFSLLIIALAVLEFFRGRREAQSLGDDEKRLAGERTRFLANLRERYLHRVKEGLQDLALIALNLHELPDAIARPALVVRESVESSDEHALPIGTTLNDVYDHAERQLLVLGEPGAGKTIALLTLAQTLVERAFTSADDQLPVVFDLATWPGKETLMEHWLETQLHRVYGVPAATSAYWVRTQQIALLLDGFDEVAAPARVDCMEALNRYHEEHGLTSLVVCSRQKKYEEQLQGLDLHRVVLQSLSFAQVDDYLKQGGERLEALRAFMRRENLLQADDQHNLAEVREEPLYTLFQVPLFLNMAILAYEGAAPEQLPAPTGREQWVRLLFQDYVRRMLQRRLGSQQNKRRKKPETTYTEKETTHYLHWLAGQMRRHHLITFYVEDLQPDWIPLPAARTFFWLLGVLADGLALGLVAGLAFGEPVAGLLGGLLGVLFSGLNDRVELSEAIGWSWSGLVSGLLSGLLAGILIGLVVGILLGLYFGWDGGLFIWLLVGLVIGLALALFFGLVGGLISGLEGRAMKAKDRQVPGEGFHRSVYHAILVGLLAGLLVGPVVGLFAGLVGGLMFGVSTGLVFGMVAGLLAGLLAGGRAAFRYALLRGLLQGGGVIPYRYVMFLDYCADHILLQRVGGGFRFIHLSLRDYFASLPEEEVKRVS